MRVSPRVPGSVDPSETWRADFLRTPLAQLVPRKHERPHRPLEWSMKAITGSPKRQSRGILRLPPRAGPLGFANICTLGGFVGGCQAQTALFPTPIFNLLRFRKRILIVGATIRLKRHPVFCGARRKLACQLLPCNLAGVGGNVLGSSAMTTLHAGLFPVTTHVTGTILL